LCVAKFVLIKSHSLHHISFPTILLNKYFVPDINFYLNYFQLIQANNNMHLKLWIGHIPREQKFKC